MANVAFNIAKGRVVELAYRVENNDPANAVFGIAAIVAGGVSDATLIDLDTLSDVLATAANEATNTNYARKTLANGSLTITIDDSNDWTSVDCADQTWSAVGAGDNWTDLILYYDSDSTGGDDTNIVPIGLYDFAVTTDGNDINAIINSGGLYRAA